MLHFSVAIDRKEHQREACGDAALDAQVLTVGERHGIGKIELSFVSMDDDLQVRLERGVLGIASSIR